MTSRSALRLAVQSKIDITALPELAKLVGKGKLGDNTTFDFMLNRPGTIVNIVAFSYQGENTRLPRYCDSMSFFCPISPSFQLFLHQLLQLLPGKRKEVDDFIDPPQELVSSEVVLEDRPDYVFLEVAGDCYLFPAPLLFFPFLFPLLVSLSSQLKSMLSNLTTGQVGGHDENCVLALQSLSLSIGQPPFIKKLKQCGEHIWVGLVHLIEEHHRFGISLEPFG